jgi:hypothetical protein
VVLAEGVLAALKTRSSRWCLEDQAVVLAEGVLAALKTRSSRWCLEDKAVVLAEGVPLSPCLRLSPALSPGTKPRGAFGLSRRAASTTASCRQPKCQALP